MDKTTVLTTLNKMYYDPSMTAVEIEEIKIHLLSHVKVLNIMLSAAARSKKLT